MEEFEPNSSLGIENGGVRAKFRCLESGKEEFEISSRLGMGNGGVQAKFNARNRKWRISIQIKTLGNGNAGVRAKFRSSESGFMLYTCSTVPLLYIGSHLIKIALETYTIPPPANSRKEFRA